MLNGRNRLLKRSKLLDYQSDPLLFLNEAIDDLPRWEKQKEILNSVKDHRNTLVKSCHGVGKTFTAKDVVLWFLYCFPPSKIITTAPSWPQVEKILWSEINKAHANAKINLGGTCLKTSVTIDPEWFAIGLSPRIDAEDEGKRLTGFHGENVLVVFDEAPACNEALWTIKDALMTSQNVRFLAIGNPVVDSGSFFEGFRSGNANKITMDIFQSPNFKVNNICNIDKLIELSEMDIDQRENKYNAMQLPFGSLTNPRWAVDRLLEWGHDSPLFQSRVLSQFPTKATDTIISLSSLEKCKDIDKIRKSKKTLGVDVARFGDDNTVLYGYDNGIEIYKQKFNGQNLVKTANLIIHKIKYEHYDIVVIDDTGLGGGVTDIVQTYLSENPVLKTLVVPINFAEAAYSDDYDGIVTEMYFNAKRIIENKEVQVIDDGDLFQELSSRKYKFTGKGKFKIESKGEYKKRTKKKSPDEADAFVLCMWGLRQSTIYNANTFNSEEGREQYDW